MRSNPLVPHCASQHRGFLPHAAPATCSWLVAMVASGALACGGGQIHSPADEDEISASEAEVPQPSSARGAAGASFEPRAVTENEAVDAAEEPGTSTESPTDARQDDAELGEEDGMQGSPADDQPERRCAPPAGVSGAPRTIAEMVELLNALPRPTSIACFIESLDRPLSIYATRSPLSAQPAVGEDLPRVFFMNDDLAMSVVMGGPAGETLEFGLRVEDERSVRGELEFPLRSFVTEETIRDRIMLGSSSLCANCHRSEQPAPAQYFGGTVISGVVMPADQYELSVENLAAQREECGDASDTRCRRFAALFDFGTVEQVPFR